MPDDEELLAQQSAQTIYDNGERTLQYQLDSDSIIEEIEHILKSEQMSHDKHGQPVWTQKPNSKPLINDKGINTILTILRSHVTKIFILSDLEDEDIRNITRAVSEDLIDALYYNWDEWAVPTSAAASTIVDLVVNTVYATLRKGYRAQYLNFLKTTQRIQDVQSVTAHERGPSASRSLFMPWKK